jgi:hypothetical protein
MLKKLTLTGFTYLVRMSFFYRAMLTLANLINLFYVYVGIGFQLKVKPFPFPLLAYPFPT